MTLRLSVIFCLCLVSGLVAQEGLVDQYFPAGQRGLPADPAGLGRAVDAGPDGRLVVAVGLEIYREDAPGAGSYTLVGTLPGTPPMFGPAFVKVSPDGSKIAYGDNSGGVGVYDFPSLTGVVFNAFHFDATWLDDDHLAITDFGVVTLLDVTSADPMNPTNPVLIQNIGGASAGIAFDDAGNLFTGNGFALGGPSATGDIKVFDAASWSAAITSGMPLDFENGGQFLGNVLSASPLGFDGRGNLFVGGGDAFGGGASGYAAVISRGAVESALAGAGALDANDPLRALQLDPNPASGSFYSVTYDPASGELLLGEFGAASLWVFKPSTYPGSGEDLRMAAGVNAPATLEPAVHTVQAGDAIMLELSSPLGGNAGLLPLVVAQAHMAGTSLVGPPAFPSLHLDFSPGAMFPVAVFVPPAVLLPAGGVQSYGFTGAAGLGGLAIRVQAFVGTPLAGNGFFSGSNAQEFVF